MSPHAVTSLTQLTKWLSRVSSRPCLSRCRHRPPMFLGSAPDSLCSTEYGLGASLVSSRKISRRVPTSAVKQRCRTRPAVRRHTIVQSQRNVTCRCVIYESRDVVRGRFMHVSSLFGCFLPISRRLSSRSCECLMVDGRYEPVG